MDQQLTPGQAKKLGTVIRATRDRQRMSRAELGRRIQLSVSRIVQYENGVRQFGNRVIVDAPPAPMLGLIAEALGTSPDDLLIAAGLTGVEIPVLAPLSAPEAKVIETIRREADHADIIDLRISAAKDAWQDFVSSLDSEAKSRLLTLLVSGTLQPGTT